MPAADRVATRASTGFAARRSVERLLFRLLLTGLGLGLELACRCSASFRRQVTREVAIEIASADGVAHHYRFTPRHVSSRAGKAVDPALSVCFADARQGLVALLSPHAIGRIIHALLEGGAVYRGNAVLVLWFFALTRYVLPIGLERPLAAPLPGSYVAHDRAGKAASRITVEPPASELDPAWPEAHLQRARMVMTRGSAGDAVAMW